MKERETNRGEVNRQREDNKGHDPEDGLHGPQIGVVYTRFSSQLKTHLKWLQYLKNVAVINMVHTTHDSEIYSSFTYDTKQI